MCGRAHGFGYIVLTVLTRPLCAMCAVMSKWLRDLKVTYREIDVTAVPEARRILRALTRGSLSVPTLVFHDGRVLVEPTREALLQALRQRPR